MPQLIPPRVAITDPRTGLVSQAWYRFFNSWFAQTGGYDGVVPVSSGGTGITSYTVGDIIYASGAATLSKLPDVATGNVLLSGGVSSAPSWGKVGLTTHVSGTLPVANGGTGATSLTGYVKGSGTSALTASATVPTTDLSGTLQAAQMPALTGDVTTPGASLATTLASVIVAGGPIGSATVAPVITYDAKGRLTAVSSATITPAVSSITGFGTGVATALAVNTGTSGAFVVNGGALGTPSSGTLTNATGLPVSTGISGLGTSVATALAVNVGTDGAFVVKGGALGSPSSVGTMPAFTLGGTVSGGSQTVNNLGKLITGGTAFSTSDAKMGVKFDGSATNGEISDDTNAAAGTDNAKLFVRGGSVVGSIQTTTTTTAYNTSSDGRRKPNRRPIDDSGAILDALNPVYHDWDIAPGVEVPGFIAQEVYQVAPTAATPGDSDPDKRPGDEGYIGWMREDSKLIPYLVAEIKSLRARVAALEGR